MVRIRLARFGRRNRPQYRVVVIAARNQRDGRAIEYLGAYNPYEAEEEKKCDINVERAKYWISVGAQPSETVWSLLKSAGVKDESTSENSKRRARRKRAKAAK